MTQTCQQKRQGHGIIYTRTLQLQQEMSDKAAQASKQHVHIAAQRGLIGCKAHLMLHGFEASGRSLAGMGGLGRSGPATAGRHLLLQRPTRPSQDHLSISRIVKTLLALHQGPCSISIACFTNQRSIVRGCGVDSKHMQRTAVLEQGLHSILGQLVT